MARAWPSWVSIALGGLLLALGLYLGYARSYADYAGMTVAGALLLALGLHALQASYDMWCADCDWDDCACDHCGDCSGGDCCGNCACAEKGGGHGGHDGHN